MEMTVNSQVMSTKSATRPKYQVNAQGEPDEPDHLINLSIYIQ